jgi:hypothetical protein
MQCTFCTILDRLLTDACNKDFIALVQLRGTFSTKNNAMNTHFLHDRRKSKLIVAVSANTVVVQNVKLMFCAISIFD